MRKISITAKVLFLAVILSFMVGCGGGSSSANPTADEIALDKIMAYAEDGSNTAPTLQDYIDAGVTGVSSENLAELNTVVAGLEADDVDSKEELEALTSELNINIKPTANAGADKTVEVNKSITIIGIGTDTDGTIASYEWKKGTTVLATTASFSYTPTAVGTDTLSLTVTDDDGATATDTMNVFVEPAPIGLTIISPTNNQVLGNNDSNNVVDIIANIVYSEFDILTVTAVFEGNSVILNYSTGPDCSGTTFCFIGQVSTSGLAQGIYTLIVTAEDIKGSAVSKSHTIVVDNRPILSVQEPLQNSVARPDLPLDITCSDDEGDCEITVSINGITLISAVNVLYEDLDLSAYEGRTISLNIEGKDSSNQLSSQTITVYVVEKSSSLTEVKEFSGSIIDFDGQHALILNSESSGDRLTIQEITSNVTIEVEVPEGLSIRSGFLTPTGAIYTVSASLYNSLSVQIYDWNNSQLHDLGSACCLSVKGDYAIWNDGTLWLRQFSTKTNTQGGPASVSSLGSNGVVASHLQFSGENYPCGIEERLFEIIKFDAGVLTTLVEPNCTYKYYSVLTDGNGFVYITDDRSGLYAITYHDGINETYLTDFRRFFLSSGVDYQINNGWIAFTELGSLGQEHVWTRDPNGTLLQRTFFGSNSGIDGLSSDGEVMLIYSGRRYLSSTSGQLIEVGSNWGSSTNINGVWYITLGRSLFMVNLNN